MARRGVWELKELLLRYSRTGGSSRGVREFVEHDLVNFARENPQINIQTSFRNSHPFVVGEYGAFDRCQPR
jgi:large subunit ribosomal protein L43